MEQVTIRRMLMCKTLMCLPAILMLISEWSHYIKSQEITVDPPKNIRINDTGHLGPLYIHWTAPASLANLTDCSMRYHLEYFNTYQNRWTVIRTVRTWYSAQFDLEKEVRVRISTLLRGACVNGTEIMSPVSETVLTPTFTGPVGSRIQDLKCVFYQKTFMECTWQKGSEEPAHSQRSLHFWHQGMEQAEECPQYIFSNGDRIGCTFSGESLPEFTNFNICVNSSSPQVALRAAFFSLQVQNHVKPAAIEMLHLEAGADRCILVHWDLPHERIPRHCLEHEVEAREEGVDQVLQRNITREMMLNSSLDGAQRKCFRVRSRIHQYCADRGFWSDWSHWSCYPDLPPDSNTSESNAVVVCALVISLIIFMFILSLCGWALWRKWKGREGKTMAFCSLHKLMEYSKGMHFFH
ncbi:interleukin-13 receptor subunit alpha-2 isoform X1 [Esox lucius]|uniref:Type I cytokine receptor cytokine-binding domain-containing protein n=1 Tax=Esox lucius TaxID=8010 RepID=A0A3P8YRI3_ESOLU|nr:interleukin-13 receptor subunit alpha-2 isoform X1 [Esox lucius]